MSAATAYDRYLPIVQFFDRYSNNPIILQDFIYACPFNQFLINHYNTMMRSSPIPIVWNSLFAYLVTVYTVNELTDLVYEALNDLSIADHYTDFLYRHKYFAHWPTGQHFCDPLTIPPSTPNTPPELPEE